MSMAGAKLPGSPSWTGSRPQAFHIRFTSHYLH